MMIPSEYICSGCGQKIEGKDGNIKVRKGLRNDK